MKRVKVPAAFTGGIPLIEHLSEPLEQAIEICQDENDTQRELSERLRQIWNLEEASNLSLRALLQDAEGLANQSLIVPSDDPSSYFFTGDTFDNDLKINQSSTISLDKSAGYVLLPITDQEDLSPFIGELKILSDSEGRPGDLVAIRNLSFDNEGNPVTDVALDPRSRAEEMLDGNPSTWFAWERVFVKRVQKIKRSGPNNAIVSDTNGKEEDLVLGTGGFGLKWSGVIPGQGEVEKDVFTFYGSGNYKTNSPFFAKKEKTPTVKIDTIADLNSTQKKARLILEFSFTSSVPLSTIRITPLVESGMREPTVKSISALGSNGVSATPPGLPRKVTSLSGRAVSIKKATEASVGRADLIGSGVFQIRTGASGVKSVRIELETEATPLRFGAAHQFYVKNTETNEKTYVLGFRTKNKTTRGQERIDGEAPWSGTQESSTSPSLLSGPLYSILIGAQNYQAAKAAKAGKQYNIPTDNTIAGVDLNRITNPRVKTGNDALDMLLNQRLNQAIGQAASGPINAITQANTANNLLKSALGPGASAALGLTGPLGLLAGAALSGNLFNKKKTVTTTESSGVDVFAAERAALLIRQIAFDSRVYGERGDLFTEELTLPGEARAVSLFTQIEIPRDWPSGPWVTAQIKAIVNGTELDWVDIKPNGSPWVNDPAPTLVTFEVPVSKIKLKLSLARPTGIEYEAQSPILTSYVIKGLPK